MVLATIVVLGACGGDGPAAVCNDVERILEPGNIHVLPGADVAFQNSPPTSGPHRVPAPAPRVRGTPVEEASQVAALEQGYVLIQYDGSVEAADIAKLESLVAVDGRVVVAPGARTFDGDAAVAFTSWSKRQLCAGTDIDAATAFISDHAGVFFTTHE